MPRRSKKSYKKPFKYQVADKAESAYNMAVALKRLVNVERKYFDSAIADSAIASTGEITDLSAIPQGDTAITRDGDSLKPLGFQMRYKLTGDVNATFDTVVRWILFRMKHENAVVPTVADILEGSTETSMFNFTERSRFTVLADKTHTLHVNDSTILPIMMGKTGNKLTGHMTFVTGTVNHENGGLYLLRISNQTAVANQPRWDSNQRITYVDN